MKRLSIALLVLVFVSCASLPVLYAQAFPTTVLVSWDANPASDNVSSYTLSIDTIPGSAVDPTTKCIAGTCSASLVVPSTGPHTLHLTASNMWGISPSYDYAFTASAPGKSINIKITKP